MKRKIVLRNSSLIGLFTVLLAVPLLSQQAPVGGSGTTNYIPIWTNSTTLGNSGFFENGPGGNVGLGTTNPGAQLEVDTAAPGAAISGNATRFSTSAVGVAGTGKFRGLVGSATSTFGFGGPKYGVVGTANSSNGAGVFGQAPNFGVSGAATGAGGAGVYGNAPLYGVWGNSATGDGVHGTTSAVNTASGVAGISTGGNVGVYGAVSGCSGGSQCLAGRFDGNVFVNGTLTKNSGSFRIDHPLDPANKYLSHSFVESPDMMNIYNGIAMLDTEGETWVNLPDYFEALNNDFRYQLTAIGVPEPNLYIAKEISGNIFKIGGGKAGSKVSWQVTGVRHDAYADAHRIKVEEEKPAQERGHYLHPELFGATKKQVIGASNDSWPQVQNAAELMTIH